LRLVLWPVALVNDPARCEPGWPYDGRVFQGAKVEVLGVDDAGEVLTLQRAAYVSEAAAHNDPSLR
jgi:hypothetical protein